MKTEKVCIKSPKQNFIERMEELLLMNILLPGQRLPSERDLAEETGVSRPVIHDALSELGARGLISIRPRHGWIVNDFVKEGSLSILNSLYRFSSLPDAEQIDDDLEEVRRIILTESLKKYFARKKKNAAPFDLAAKLESVFEEIHTRTCAETAAGIRKITEKDFLFYRTIIEAGNNIIFVLLFNSSKELYHKKLERFFSSHRESCAHAAEMKRALIDAIRCNKEKKALDLIGRITSYSTYASTYTPPDTFSEKKRAIRGEHNVQYGKIS